MSFKRASLLVLERRRALEEQHGGPHADRTLTILVVLAYFAGVIGFAADGVGNYPGNLTVAFALFTHAFLAAAVPRRLIILLPLTLPLLALPVAVVSDLSGAGHTHTDTSPYILIPVSVIFVALDFALLGASWLVGRLSELVAIRYPMTPTVLAGLGTVSVLGIFVGNGHLAQDLSAALGGMLLGSAVLTGLLRGANTSTALSA